MQKKCSSCELVNWPDALNCRRCGHPLGVIQTAATPRLVGKEIVRETKLRLDDEVQLQQPLQRIRSGASAAVMGGILSCLTFLLLNIFLASPTKFFQQAFLEFGLILLFSLGFYGKSRVCATLLLGYFTVGKLLLLIQGQIAFAGIFIGLLFVKSLYQGWQGTIAYHQLKARKTEQPQASIS